MDQAAPLILTLALDGQSFAFFNDQRRRYFPPERNVIPAHITLFHRLPGEQLGAICADIEELAAAQSAFALNVTGLRFLGRGVAYTLTSATLMRIRHGLAQTWHDRLSQQDRQKHHPHVTVQNKVEPEAAKALLETLAATFEPFSIRAEGLDLWRYRGGRWEKARSFRFAP